MATSRLNGTDVLGYDWWQVLYNPAGLARDMYNQANPGEDKRYRGSAAATQYWNTRRAANPQSSITAARLAAGKAQQDELRAQSASYWARKNEQAKAAGIVPMASAVKRDVPLPPSMSSAPSPLDAVLPEIERDLESAEASDEAVVGFGLAPAASDEQLLVIKIKNAVDLIAREGGATGKIAFKLAPQTITNKVYSSIRSELAAGLRAKGVDAEVSVVAVAPKGRPSRNDLLTGAVIGGGVVGVGWVMWKYIFSGMFKKRSR